jgi:ribose 5-phosphate isomerase A
MDTPNSNQTLKLKQQVGFEAAKLVKDGMLVGLGTGSTATFFIESLAKRCQEGLKIKAAATSLRSEELARQKGIEIIDTNSITYLDLTIDGADEIDPFLRLIKGGGGALLREKIIATTSKEMVVIADETKLVNDLGAFGLPVEIIPFCFSSTIQKLNNKGFFGNLRMTKTHQPYITDNHNFIYDIQFNPVCKDPEYAYEAIRAIVGVVELGFFFNIAKMAIVSFKDGSIKTFTKQ